MTMRNCSEEYHKTHASELTDHLYLAACRAVTSKCLKDLGITSIVNATLELPTVAYQKQDTIQIAVEDRVSAKLNIYFDLIADKIQQVHLGGVFSSFSPPFFHDNKHQLRLAWLIIGNSQYRGSGIYEAIS